MATTVLNIPDISCEHCERTITTALDPVEGIRAVNVDIRPGTAPGTGRRWAATVTEPTTISVHRIAHPEISHAA